MERRIKITLFIFLMFLIDSCGKIYFRTTDNLAWNANEKHISRYEVTVSDWITYVVTTTFSESGLNVDPKNKKDPFYLIDSIDKIKMKLPELSLPGFSNYVIKAFLRKDKKCVVQRVWNHCDHSIIKLYIPKQAWDSIKKYNLLNLPIVGITYEQALKYIEYKQNISNTCDLYIKESKNKYFYKCYLPTPEQYDSFQTKADSFTMCPRFNFKNSLCLDCPNGKENKKHPVTKHIGVLPIYVNGYFPNYYGLYNFKGNVAEMTSVKGIAKGGSCAHYASEAYAGKNQEYVKPEMWLGFRVWYTPYPR